MISLLFGVLDEFHFHRDSTTELPSSFQPEIRQERVAFYLKSDREESNFIYLMYFVNNIRFVSPKILIQITRKALRKFPSKSEKVSIHT